MGSSLRTTKVAVPMFGIVMIVTNLVLVGRIWIYVTSIPMSTDFSFSLESERESGVETYESPFRFPTVQERVEYYMGSWYDKNLTVPSSMDSPLCRGLRISRPQSSIVGDVDVLYSRDTLFRRHEMPQHWTAHYLRDVANVLTHLESTVHQSKGEDWYVIFRIGDSMSKNHKIPVVSKSRQYFKEKEDQHEDYHRPILWPVGLDRHYNSYLTKLHKVQDEGKDTPWEQKKEILLWRGSCTGSSGKGTSKPYLRVEFVKMYKDKLNSTIDISLTGGSCDPQLRRIGKLVDKSFYRKDLSMDEMLQYKYLLSLEGNDVATNLKWLLASSSVMFMPTPTAVTYAMEDKLVPYIHYVPVKRDGSDLVEQLEWAKQNDDKCRWISEQATAYMDALWSSEEAKANNILIRSEMASLYQEKFGKALDVCYKRKEG